MNEDKSLGYGLLSAEPEIVDLPELILAGMKVTQSFSQDKTIALWKDFAPRIRQVKNRKNSLLYSVEVYEDTSFFSEFNPIREFEKWAAVEVEGDVSLPDAMQSLIIPTGRYAVFHYRGRPSQAPPVFQHIFSQWLPGSPYELDNRPHFALMGEKYKGEAPESEEEFYIPIK